MWYLFAFHLHFWRHEQSWDSNPTNDAVLSSLFNLLPELVAVGDRNPDIEAALEFYENDLPSPHVVDVELLRWKRKWCSTEDADLPTSAVQTLTACEREVLSVH